MTSPERLLEILDAKNAVPPEWRQTVASVPRELFLPETIEVYDRLISRADSPEEWLTAAYADVPILTQWNDGAEMSAGDYRLPTVSSSMPSLMLEMLSLLNVRPGDRVYEAGAGTGLLAAWLAHRQGSANVVTAEYDATVAQQAERNLRRAGYCPRVVCGPGEQGWAAGAPYDRWIGSYTVPEVPYAAIQQTPHGRIVTPWGGSFFSHNLAVVDVDEGVGRGRFQGYPSFMRTRIGRPHRGFLSDFLHHQGEEEQSRTGLSPLDVAGSADALFFIGLDLPDAWHLLVEASDGSGERTLWILADDRKSWAAAEYVPGEDSFEIGQFGPRHLWDEVEESYEKWAGWGRPSRDRAGLTITKAAQHVWLDTPDNVIS
ncbi:protein-L-isoaspartate O-methyltransferase [Streptomyces sp. NPDC090442]|uniref:protein-L-isoaspartate O-methyltransferase family protein n=1 Tax=Streptomyces sp. NPDC090442 TaxID=3365962 RepID=UPI00381DA04A